MFLNNKNKEFIMNVCEGCKSYNASSKLASSLLKFGEQKRIKKLIQEPILEFRTLCLCEVVVEDRESYYEKYARELALNIIDALNEEDEKIFNKIIGKRC